MELAKVTSKGQVTIPKEIREKLNLKKGDKVLFIEKEDGILIANASMMEFKRAQAAFSAEARDKNITEEELNSAVKKIRRNLSGKA
ncbi:AbrB/MazE/SpoVT family DNA-binding domain-containing protein [Mesoaciditoga lauensis]|uniref:AbrB/MazE/SpoVT family DNA-binding domain-containing protein n=1 Tax=Mesoaciditoga lauensis TaxID=1495039 RepID=UPI0005614458|nr:AbrB/MazE/SpoVT family DNA-binding domain-containing protein [Mesoaciditoga lauensis]